MLWMEGDESEISRCHICSNGVASGVSYGSSFVQQFLKKLFLKRSSFFVDHLPVLLIFI